MYHHRSQTVSKQSKRCKTSTNEEKEKASSMARGRTWVAVQMSKKLSTRWQENTFEWAICTEAWMTSLKHYRAPQFMDHILVQQCCSVQVQPCRIPFIMTCSVPFCAACWSSVWPTLDDETETAFSLTTPHLLEDSNYWPKSLMHTLWSLVVHQLQTLWTNPETI